MAKKKRLLPFELTPVCWFLENGSKEYYIAKAKYELNGDDLELRLAEIEKPDSIEKEIRLLELRKNSMSHEEYKKTLANLKNEEYIFVDYRLDKEKGSIEVKLDWNDHFIQYLKENGYVGETDLEIMTKWFEEWCRACGGISQTYYDIETSRYQDSDNLDLLSEN